MDYSHLLPRFWYRAFLSATDSSLRAISAIPRLLIPSPTANPDLGHLDLFHRSAMAAHRIPGKEGVFVDDTWRPEHLVDRSPD